jgi:hypothetical protein
MLTQIRDGKVTKNLKITVMWVASAERAASLFRTEDEDSRFLSLFTKPHNATFQKNNPYYSVLRPLNVAKDLVGKYSKHSRLVSVYCMST